MNERMETSSYLQEDSQQHEINKNSLEWNVTALKILNLFTWRSFFKKKKNQILSFESSIFLGCVFLAPQNPFLLFADDVFVFCF